MSLKQTLKLAKQLENQTKNNNASDNHADKRTTNLSALKSTTKPRNHLAFNPLLKKGGVHQKDNIEAVRKKKRRETKQSLRQTDWLSEI